MNLTPASEIRSRLDHPVIDSDGHIVEFFPAILSAVREIGGDANAKHADELYAGKDTSPEAGMFDVLTWFDRDWEGRRDRRTTRPSWWSVPAANGLDRATAMFPRLLHERLPSLGIDFAVCYPTLGFTFPWVADDDLRRTLCRAYNTVYAGEFEGLGDRLTPVGLIPMHTPEEAIDELQYSVTNLGIKAFVVGGAVWRPIPALLRAAPDLAYLAPWFDPLGLDSEHDYDPFWAKCEELGVALSSHGGTIGFGTRRSISNFVFNHSGHFAANGEAFAKALWLGGVTRRFPRINFAFLEGGVAWAAALLNDITEIWKKRNGERVEQYNPERLDLESLRDNARRYGSDRFLRLVDEQLTHQFSYLSGDREDPAHRDEWRACAVSSADELASLFVDHFYFGCEADDRLASIAFDTRLLASNRPLRGLFGSDIGHFDVEDMNYVLHEVYEQVEDGLLTPKQFEDFTAANCVRFYSEANHDFFRGTTVEAYAASIVTDERS